MGAGRGLTAHIDRREKFRAYRTLPSLREYLLIAQDLREVEIFRRADDWAPERVTAGSVRLAGSRTGLATPLPAMLR